MKNSYFPYRLELALDLRGMTRSELATRTDVSSTYITLMLNGERGFNEEMMLRCAAALDVPPAFFQVPQRELDLRVVSFRQKARTPKKYTNQILAEFSLMTHAVEKMTRITRVDTLWKWIDALAPHVTPSMQQIESIAQDARIILNVPHLGMVPNVIRAVERGGISVAPLSVKINDQALLSEGISQHSSASVPAIGYFAGAQSGDGQRFTIAHELGHILLHRYREPSVSKIKEREASMFASAFLFPQEDARAFIHEDTQLQAFIPLKARWGISIASMITRGAQLGLISRERQRSLMKQMSARGWRMIEPVTVEYEEPLLIKQMVGKAFGKSISPSISEVSDIIIENFLGVPFNMVNTWSHGLLKVQDEFNIDF